MQFPIIMQSLVLAISFLCGVSYASFRAQSAATGSCELVHGTPRGDKQPEVNYPCTRGHSKSVCPAQKIDVNGALLDLQKTAKFLQDLKANAEWTWCPIGNANAMEGHAELLQFNKDRWKEVDTAFRCGAEPPVDGLVAVACANCRKTVGFYVFDWYEKIDPCLLRSYAVHELYHIADFNVNNDEHQNKLNSELQAFMIQLVFLDRNKLTEKWNESALVAMIDQLIDAANPDGVGAVDRVEVEVSEYTKELWSLLKEVEKKDENVGLPLVGHLKRFFEK